ncbi:DNA repair protein RecO [Evansella cellulosilytica]|uniref:DNA repair protein RecO n=1 Tax=Evansella cellulosilytica (strain ATCC 21833 / DSM 2522 / FERM P-1141 / JCM 9156 / N-4) TaxID=649639 RepID=E6TW49_EVAC2|nr:DNA repair protein RecO [Evansella cellulosilytica]ADU29872.1 DNA repair protein RecO [Evansella cellulosilytica DSM 2522]
MLQKVEGLVIRTNDYGETNKIVTIFTRENGKIALMARGAKRPKSRFASSAQIFVYGIFIYQSSTGIGTLSQSDVIDSFRDVRSDLKLTAHGAYIVELIDRLTEDRERNPFLFELLYQTFQFLNEGLDPEILTRIFETKMLHVAGVTPVLTQCTSCGSESEFYVFSMKQAGLLCGRCQYEDPNHIKVNIAVIKLLRLFQQLDIQRLGKVNVKQETKKQLKEILSYYYDEFVGIHLKSKRFLDQVDRLYPN